MLHPSPEQFFPKGGESDMHNSLPPCSGDYQVKRELEEWNCFEEWDFKWPIIIYVSFFFVYSIGLFAFGVWSPGKH
jgi:hypothetical protein